MRWWVLGFLFATSCVGEVNVEDVSFPCRSQEDCAEGFVCSEERFVCVATDAPAPQDAGNQQDMGPPDAQTPDAGL